MNTYERLGSGETGKGEGMSDYIQHKVLAIQALQQMKGDDLFRAQLAFRPYIREMDKEYGESGKTRAQILAEYQAHEDKCLAAIAWLNSL